MSDDFAYVKDGSIWAFSSPLRFPDSDREKYPWLNASPRYYKVVKLLSKGGFAVAYLGEVCNAKGTPEADTQIVLKFPNIRRTGEFTLREQERRLRLVDSKSLDEWRITRLRLRNSPYATYICDLDMQWIQWPNSEPTPCIVTVQEYLHSHLPLLTWMQKQDRFPTSEREQKRWNGLFYGQDWKRICGAIATAIADVHNRRVVHGDLWPANIFVESSATIETLGPSSIRLIDFGESATFFPSGSDMAQNDHPYRAPERGLGHFIPTEQIDVYSMGVIAAYLAAGGPPQLAQDMVGRGRRSLLRAYMQESNPRLLRQIPELLDVVATCTSVDPVERPSLAELLASFDHSHPPDVDWNAHGKRMLDRMQDMFHRYEEVFATGPLILRHLVDQRIYSIESLLKEFDSELVRTEGSREEMLRVLVSLFSLLKPGDSWTSLTTPSVWQAQGLGLDGRYITATVHAVRRGGAIHRGYVISVEETGEKWWKFFIESLKAELTPERAHLQTLVLQCELAGKDFLSAAAGNNFLSRGQGGWQQFTDVLAVLDDTVKSLDLIDLVNDKSFESIGATTNLFLGLIPVATRRDVTELRISNPASLMAAKRAPNVEPEWALVITDIRGRDSGNGNASEPTLRGVRVYNSVDDNNIPTERITLIERALRQSVNIGSDIAIVAECAKRASQQMKG